MSKSYAAKILRCQNNLCETHTLNFLENSRKFRLADTWLEFAWLEMLWGRNTLRPHGMNHFLKPIASWKSFIWLSRPKRLVMSSKVLAASSKACLAFFLPDMAADRF
jgi:hypothetical protein